MTPRAQAEAPPTPDEMRRVTEDAARAMSDRHCELAGLTPDEADQRWRVMPLRDKQEYLEDAGVAIAAALSTTAAQAEAQLAVCSEIQRIMATYREQEAERGYVDTPGGLEHMGDVWRLLAEWDDSLRAALAPPAPAADAEVEAVATWAEERAKAVVPEVCGDDMLQVAALLRRLDAERGEADDMAIEDQKIIANLTAENYRLATALAAPAPAALTTSDAQASSSSDAVVEEREVCAKVLRDMKTPGVWHEMSVVDQIFNEKLDRAITAIRARSAAQRGK